MENYYDKKLSFGVMFIFIIQALNLFIQTVLPEDSFLVSYSSIICASSASIVIYKNLKIVYRKNYHLLKKSYMLFFGLYLISVLYSIYRNEPVISILKDSALWTFFYWLPTGLFAYTISDKRILLSKIYRLSFVITALMLSIFAWYILIGSKNDAVDYNMQFSYILVFPLIIHIDKILRKFSSKILILVIIEFAAILLYGARGSLFCIASFFILKFLFSRNTAKQKFIYILVLLVAIGTMFLINNNMSVLSNFGLNSRFLSYASEGEVTFTSGRDIVWLEALSMIQNRPLLGYGIGGEYYEMSIRMDKYLFNDYLVISSTSPHNGFLEMIMCFGYPIGIIVSLYILSRLKAVKIIADDQLKCFLLILFSVYIVPSFTVGDGIFIKSGIALFIFLSNSLIKKNSRRETH